MIWEPVRAAPPSGALAADLHDRVITGLTALILEMEQFKRDQYNREGVRSAVSGFQESTRSALSQLRDVVHGLQGAPADLESSLASSVRSGPLFELRRRTGVATRLRMAPDWPRRLDPLTAINLYRILEQALRNVADHSGARNVTVVLRAPDPHLVVEVSDDGAGFPATGLVKGQGVAGMEQRAILLGGRLEVANRGRGGALIRATVPHR